MNLVIRHCATPFNIIFVEQTSKVILNSVVHCNIKVFTVKDNGQSRNNHMKVDVYMISSKGDSHQKYYVLMASIRHKSYQVEESSVAYICCLQKAARNIKDDK